MIIKAYQFHAFCLLCLSLSTLLHAFIDGPYSLWWRLTQIGSWSLITNLVFAFFALLTDLRSYPEKVHIKLDIFFTVCLTLAVGVCIFYLVVVLPFTPRFNIDAHCHNTAKDDDCMSLGGFIVMSIVHAVPLITSTCEMIFIEHKFAFENIKVELFVLSSYVFVFLAWSVLCYQLLHASPYYVQDMVGSAVSVLIYVLCIMFFIGIFFLVRCIHHRIWPSITKVHYTDQLIAHIEEQWSAVPAAADFEVLTFKNSRPFNPNSMDWKSPHNSDVGGDYNTGEDGVLGSRRLSRTGSLNAPPPYTDQHSSRNSARGGRDESDDTSVYR